MKLSGYILAVYLLLLSSLACCAFDNCPDDKIDLTGRMGQTTDHDNEKKKCNNCSPLFNCEGCATATIAFQPIQFEILPLHIVSVYGEYIQTTLSGIKYDFWQPPKMS